MSQVDTSHDDAGSGPHSPGNPASESGTAAADKRSESWSVVAADGSTHAAPGQLDEATVARILANKPRHVPHRASQVESESREEFEPLIDFLGDEEVTLLDLDLLSCDLSLLSVEVVPVGNVPTADTASSAAQPPSVEVDEQIVALHSRTTHPTSPASDRQLKAVLHAWPRLPQDLRDAIWWIARGGARRAPRAQ